jgi:hypothetical protein
MKCTSIVQLTIEVAVQVASQDKNMDIHSHSCYKKW